MKVFPNDKLENGICNEFVVSSSGIESFTELEHLMKRKQQLQPMLERFTGQKLPPHEVNDEVNKKTQWDAILREAVKNLFVLC